MDRKLLLHVEEFLNNTVERSVRTKKMALTENAERYHKCAGEFRQWQPKKGCVSK